MKGGNSQIDWSKVSDFSEGIKEKIKRYEIGDGICVEVFDENKEPGKQQVDFIEKGKVWLAEDLTLEVRNKKEELLEHFDIEEVDSFTKCQTTEKDNGKKVNLITWTTKSGNTFGIGFYKVSERNMLYEYIGNLQKEVQKGGAKEDLGFGLFD